MPVPRRLDGKERPRQRIRATASSRRAICFRMADSKALPATRILGCRPDCKRRTEIRVSKSHPIPTRVAMAGWDLHLQHVAFARDHLVKHGADDTPEQQTRNKSGHNYDRERFLRIGADSRGKSGGE